MVEINRNKYSNSLRFKPHMNSALGKYYSSKSDYLADMKKGGFEPYTGKEPESKVKKFVVTDKLRDITKAIKQQTVNGQFRPSSALKQELIKNKVIIKKSEYEKLKTEATSKRSGGFSE